MSLGRRVRGRAGRGGRRRRPDRWNPDGGSDEQAPARDAGWPSPGPFSGRCAIAVATVLIPVGIHGLSDVVTLPCAGGVRFPARDGPAGGAAIDNGAPMMGETGAGHALVRAQRRGQTRGGMGNAAETRGARGGGPARGPVRHGARRRGPGWLPDLGTYASAFQGHIAGRGRAVEERDHSSGLM